MAARIRISTDCITLLKPPQLQSAIEHAIFAAGITETIQSIDFVNDDNGNTYFIVELVAINAAYGSIVTVHVEDVPDFSMDRVVEIMHERGVTNAFVMHTGGNCATIFGGATYRNDGEDWDRHAVIAGPGDFKKSPTGPRAFGNIADFCYGPDDDGTARPTYVIDGDDQSIAEALVVFALKATA